MARKTAPSVRKAFYEKRKKNQEQLTAERVEKEHLRHEKELKKQKEKEALTIQLGKYGGLWTSDELEDKLKEIPPEKQKEALPIQLKFRHKVMLQSSPAASMWYMSQGGKQKSVPELFSNLKTIVNYNHVNQPPNPTSGEIYRTQEDRRKLLAESVSKIQEQTKADKLKIMSKKRQRESHRRLSSPTKRHRPSSSINIPDFVGKRVEHLYEDELTGAEEWYEGMVIRRVSDKRTKDPLKILYEIHYGDGENAEINLAEDFINGELRIIDEVEESDALPSDCDL